MRWEDERYVRVYTRDTVDWLVLSFHAKALWLMLLRKADRAGIITLGKRGRDLIGAAVGHPEMRAELVEALDELLADGCCELSQDGTQLVIPNFIEAQEATKSPNERQREYRLRARDAARAGLPPASQKGCSIYFIQSENGGAVKIGRAEDLAKRLVGLQTGRPDKLVVIAAAPGTRENESEMHRLLAPWRERGEWFSPSASVMRAAACVNERGSGAWDVIPSIIRDVSGDVLSPVAKPETSSVTPSRAVPCRSEPSHAISSASQGKPTGSPDAGEDLPDATADAVEVPERPALTLAYAEPDRPAEKPAPKPPRPAKPKSEPKGDARHAPLVASLVATHAEVKGAPYGFAGGRDAKAVTELLALADQNPATRGEAAPSEILRRWGIALRWRGFPACTGLLAFRDNWNAYVAEQASAKPSGDRPRLGPAPTPAASSGDRPRF